MSDVEDMMDAEDQRAADYGEGGLRQQPTSATIKAARRTLGDCVWAIRTLREAALPAADGSRRHLTTLDREKITLILSDADFLAYSELAGWDGQEGRGAQRALIPSHIAAAAMQDDIAAALRALGVGDHARPLSPHEVMVREVIPGIENLRGQLASAEQSLREHGVVFNTDWPPARRPPGPPAQPMPEKNGYPKMYG